MKTFKTPEQQNFYKDFVKVLKDQFNYDDELIEKIYDKVEYATNKNFNLEYYQSGYDDYIDEDVIEEFIEKRSDYGDCKDGYYDNLQEAKYAFNDFIRDKATGSWNCYYYYYDELAKELSMEVESKEDGYKYYTDGSDIINCLRDNLGILDFEIDGIKLCLNEYHAVIYTREDESNFTNGFYNGDYLEDEYSKNHLKTDGLILQKLCKKNGFNIKDIFQYQKLQNGDCKENTKKARRLEELYENNQTFKSLYREFVNCMGYGEDLCLLINLSIEDILNLYVKDSDFTIGKGGTLGFDGSIFEVELNKPFDVKSKDLSLVFYKGSRIKRTYDFCSNVFN